SRLRGERTQHRPTVVRPRPEPVAVYDTIVAERLGGRPVVLQGGEVRAPGLNPERQHQASIGGASAAVNSDAWSLPETDLCKPPRHGSGFRRPGSPLSR